jgi:transcriptional regulator GlxA family with amidase domain
LTQCHEVEGVLRGIYAQMVTARPLRDRVILQYLRTFIRLLEQRLNQPESAPVVVPVGPYSSSTAKALVFLRENLDRRVTIRELAERAGGGSVTRFCARFRRELRVAPGAHHLRLRLDAARQALRQPESRVTHVAMRYGFSSSQHFSTAFRRMFGVTPRNWQRAGE